MAHCSQSSVDSNGECTISSDLEDEQQWGKDRHAPRYFPLKGLQKSFMGKRTVRPFQSLSPAAAANNSTFPALLTVWAAASLLLKKRSFGHNAPASDGGETGAVLSVSSGVDVNLSGRIAELDAQIKLLQAQQQQHATLQLIPQNLEAQFSQRQEWLEAQQHKFMQEQQEAQGALLRQHAAALEQVQAQMKERQQQQEAELLRKVEAQLSLQQQQHQVQELQSMQLEQKQSERDEARKQLNTMAVRTMCALGIDLSKPKYRPGLEAAMSTLTTLCTSNPLEVPKHSRPQQGNSLDKKHQPGLAVSTAILSSLSMLLGEAGHANAADQPGMEAGSHALAALCCDSISTATMNDFQHQVRTLSRASQALTEKGITPHDEVHKPGMLAAVSVLAALGGIKPAPKQEQEEDEDDGLYFQDQAATVNALICMSMQQEDGGKDRSSNVPAGQRVTARKMLSNRLVANVGGNIKMPQPDVHVEPSELVSMSLHLRKQADEEGVNDQMAPADGDGLLPSKLSASIDSTTSMSKRVLSLLWPQPSSSQ